MCQWFDKVNSLENLPRDDNWVLGELRWAGMPTLLEVKASSGQNTTGVSPTCRWDCERMAASIPAFSASLANAGKMPALLEAGASRMPASRSPKVLHFLPRQRGMSLRFPVEFVINLKRRFHKPRFPDSQNAANSIVQ